MLMSLFKRFKSATSLVTSNPLLINVKDEYLDMIDRDSDDYVVQMKQKLINHLKKMMPIYNSYHGNFYNDYSEVTLYLILKSRGHMIRAIPRTPESTADFCITFDNTEYNIETKNPLPMNPERNIIGFQVESHESQVELDRTKKPGMVNFGKEVVYSPHIPNNAETYDHHSNLMVINNIIDKIDQNCKISQLSENSVLLFDLTLLTMHTAPTCSPFVIIDDDNVVVSAPLWNICYGKEGSHIYRIDYHSRGNLDGYMTRNGVMHDNAAIRAIVFRFDHPQDGTRFYGFTQNRSNLRAFLELICDEVNDENNSLFSASIQ